MRSVAPSPPTPPKPILERYWVLLLCVQLSTLPGIVLILKVFSRNYGWAKIFANNIPMVLMFIVGTIFPVFFRKIKEKPPRNGGWGYGLKILAIVNALMALGASVLAFEDQTRS